MNVKSRNYFMLYIGVLLIFSFSSSTVGLIKPKFIINENQILYLFSTCAQVVAAIFGLTITAYVFLKTELDKQIKEDETLLEIITIIKKYYSFVITINSLSALAIIVFCIFCMCSLNIQHIINTITLNTSISLFIVYLISTVTLVIEMARPDKEEYTSNNIINEIENKSKNEYGNIEEFLQYYNRIENKIQDYTNRHLIINNENKYQKTYISKTKLVRFIFEAEIINKETLEELIELIRYRNALIHGNNFKVSMELINMARRVSEKIKDI